MKTFPFIVLVLAGCNVEMPHPPQLGREQLSDPWIVDASPDADDAPDDANVEDVDADLVDGVDASDARADADGD